MSTSDLFVSGLLTFWEVAEMFSVDPRIVSCWVNHGKLEAVRTLGGHRRFRASEILALTGDRG
jgi:excisionase family DNA binding protein